MEFDIKNIIAVIAEDCDINPLAARWLVDKLRAAEK